MDVMKEILKVIASKTNVRKIFPELREKKSKQTTKAKYLDGLLTGKYANDQQAAKDIYGTDVPDQRFRTLKSRVFESVINGSFYLEVKQPDQSEYMCQHNKCSKYLVCAQTLIGLAFRSLGFSLAKKAYSIARSYQFTELSVQLCGILSETSALWSKADRVQLYSNDLSSLMSQLEAEYRTGHLLDMFVLDSVVPSNSWAKMVEKGRESLSKITSLAISNPTHILILNKFRMEVALYEYCDQAEDVVQVCDEAIKYLRDNPRLSQPARIGEFKLRKMMMLLFVQEIEQANRSTLGLLLNFQSGGTNWYIALYFITVVKFRIGEYKEAEGLINEAKNHSKFDLLDNSHRELVFILDAYLVLADLLGITGSKRTHKRFRLSRYINSLEEESKKKKTTNIAIIISHICLAIALDDYDEADEQADGLQDYIANYLQEPHFNRVRVFLDLLASFSRGNYYATTIEKSNRKLLPLLQETKNDHSPPTLFEYMQFEVLYDALLKHVRKHEAA